MPSRTDHPRVCGEHPAMVCTTPAAPGSSPRVRGTHLLICDCVRVRGIIPACAGNTMPMFSPWRKPRDHPRVCGEHDIQLTVTQCAPGSSPRVRGTLHGVAVGRAETGIIPACAGNTVVQPGVLLSEGDHPRVCGEHLAGMSGVSPAMGSSPRVRGTRVVQRVGQGIHGIIPACAGNTCACATTCPATRDHPRVCGEHFL